MKVDTEIYSLKILQHGVRPLIGFGSKSADPKNPTLEPMMRTCGDNVIRNFQDGDRSPSWL